MRTFMAALVFGAISAFSASATTIVSFTSVPTAGNVNADFEGAGVSGFNLGRSAGLEAFLGTSSTYNSKDWTIGGDKLTALVANDALFWGFSSSLRYDLTSLSFGYDRSSTGPSAIAVDLFLRDIATNTVYFQGEIFRDENVNPNSSVTFGTANIDLTAFDNVENAFFRLSGWNATSDAGTFDIENRASLGGKGIVVTGALSPVPLPAGLPMLAAGLGLMAVLRRRRT